MFLIASYWLGNYNLLWTRLGSKDNYSNAQRSTIAATMGELYKLHRGILPRNLQELGRMLPVPTVVKVNEHISLLPS